MSRRGLPMIAAAMLLLGGVFPGGASAVELPRFFGQGPSAAGLRGHAPRSLGRNSDAVPRCGAVHRRRGTATDSACRRTVGAGSA